MPEDDIRGIKSSYNHLYDESRSCAGLDLAYNDGSYYYYYLPSSKVTNCDYKGYLYRSIYSSNSGETYKVQFSKGTNVSVVIGVILTCIGGITAEVVKSVVESLFATAVI